MSGTDPHGMTDCRRTAALRERIVAGAVTADDREHAGSCRSCGPVLARAASFDRELGRAARSLITEELPRDILDPAIDGDARGFAGVRSRRSVPGLSAMIGAIAILVAATAVWLAPASPQPTGSPADSPKPTRMPGPLFRPTAEIAAHVGKLDYECNDGDDLPSSRPSAGLATTESIECVARDATGFEASISVGESAQGQVVTVWLTVEADNELGDSPIGREAAVLALDKLARAALASSYDRQFAYEVIAGRLRTLQPGDLSPATYGELLVEVGRSEAARYDVRLDTLEP